MAAAAPRGRLIAVAELADRDRDAWSELAAAALEPNPFFEPEFVVPAVRWLEEARAAALVAVEGPDGWLACLPVTLRGAPIRVRAARALRTRYSYLATPLVRGDADEGIRALVAASRSATGRRLLLLERFRADGPVGSAIARAVAEREAVEALGIGAERALLERRPDGEYHGWMSKKHARDLRRRAKRLAEEVGAEPEIADVSADPGAPAEFLAIEGAGWKGEGGTAMSSVPGGAEFFAELCAGMRARGDLELLALRTGETTLAMLCNLRSGQGSFSFKIAHDERYSRFSPGIQLEMGNAGFFHASGSAWMDSCAEPDNAMINRLWPERRQLRTSVLCPADLRGGIARVAFGAAARVRERTGRG